MSDYDCQSCGACCIEFESVPVYPHDTTPVHRTQSVRGCRKGLYSKKEIEKGVREMKRHIGGRCQSLKGEVGKSCSCATYARRPRVCQVFMPGSTGCDFARNRMLDKIKSGNSWRGYGPNWEATVQQ